MKAKIYSVPLDVPGLESVNVWVSEEGVAQHNVTSGTWPVMVKGTRVNFDRSREWPTLEIDAFEIVRILEAPDCSDRQDESARLFFHDYMEHQAKTFRRGKYAVA